MYMVPEDSLRIWTWKWLLQLVLPALGFFLIPRFKSKLVSATRSCLDQAPRGATPSVWGPRFSPGSISSSLGDFGKANSSPMSHVLYGAIMVTTLTIPEDYIGDRDDVWRNSKSPQRYKASVLYHCSVYYGLYYYLSVLSSPHILLPLLRLILRSHEDNTMMEKSHVRHSLSISVSHFHMYIYTPGVADWACAVSPPLHPFPWNLTDLCANTKRVLSWSSLCSHVTGKGL